MVLAMIIAIDGTAASGKGTLARRLAAHYGLHHLDTGLIYRGVGAAVLSAGADPADPEAAEAAARALDPSALEDPSLRGDAAAVAASTVAAIPVVRDVLRQFQRDFAQRPPGAVLDGRDIGTVVLPDADAKIFVTATLEARTDRRHKELRGRGQAVIYADVLRDLRERDERDSRRTVSPLQPAVDAFVLDTSEMSPDAVFEAVCDHIQACPKRHQAE